MNPQMTINFQWLSPLGVSVALFLLHGVLMIIVGGGALFYYRRLGATRMRGALMSERMDSEYFGRPFQQVQANNPDLLVIVDLVMDVRAGLWLAFGIFEVAVTWYGLREGQVWALWTLFLGNLAMWLGYAVVSLRFLQRGVKLGLDAPPLIFIVPTILAPVATILGLFGLQ